MIKIEVNEENAKEVLKRKQDGENICPICVKDALSIIIKNVFKVPAQGGEND
jgi:hypothetical protein